MPSSKSEEESAKESWNPTAPKGEQTITTEEPSLDLGGQFEPDGRSHQRVNEPKRVGLDDDDLLPPTRSAHGR